MTKRSNLRRSQLAFGGILFAVGLALLALGLWGYVGDRTSVGETITETPAVPVDDLPQAIPYDNPIPSISSGEESTPTPSSDAPTVRMIIESIDVDAPVITLGLEDNGIPQVPLNGEDVAWYDFSARPGAGSNAVFAGHYTWSKAGAVFWRLNEVKEGDTVRVISEDGRELVYRVFASFGVDPEDPNSLKVMAPTDRDIMTLITCGGTWLPNPSEPFGGNYAERTIVQAELVEPAVRVPRTDPSVEASPSWPTPRW